MLRAAPSCSEYSQNPHPQKIRVLRAAPSAPSAPQKSPPLKKSECSKLLRVLPKKAIVQKSPPSKSELLRVLPKKLSSQKNPHPKPPHPLPKPSTNSALQRLTITSSKPQNPHTILSLPHAPPHTIFASKKSQISHAHKHNAFQFRLRNRNISSS